MTYPSNVVVCNLQAWEERLGGHHDSSLWIEEGTAENQLASPCA